MARLLIPTRNRPTSLGNVLDFLDRFYPGTGVIVADGSHEDHKARVESVATETRDVDVAYQAFPHDMQFFDRILAVLRNESDRYFVMGADDDYPMMDLFTREEGFLDQNPDYVSAMGPTINLMYDGSPDTRTRLNIARPIENDSPRDRAMNYARWPYSTTYALTRREVLITRYERSRELFLAGYYDYGVGVQDVLQGKIRAVGELGYFGTRNTNHSYLRSDSRLIFLSRADDLRLYARNMAADFRRHAGLNEEEAESCAETIVRNFTADYCGRKAWQMEGFAESRLARDRTVQAQLSLFHDLFTADTETRERYGERLTYISDALRRNFTSSDNAGESRRYETLDQQTGIKAGVKDRGIGTVNAS